MISYDLGPSQLLGNYELTTSTKYRTKLLHEYTIYKSRIKPTPGWMVKYTTIPHLSVNTYTNVSATLQ
jgi:hypothetical protein